ncbi:MAG: outer membrane beta-barrel family protein, partial [Muribaculaceae bacterium]|nr:outer membrane beta-barrel family protein [Muribaculaceae bacterium]
IWVNLDCSARTSGNGENLYIKSYWQCDFGVYKSFANDMWSIKLQLNDIFATNRMSFISYDAISRMSINKINDTRDLTLTIRYNFNTARSRFKGHGVTNQEKERL